MNPKLSWLSLVYGWLLQLYPRHYYVLFADEMRAVFAEGLTDAQQQGWVAMLLFCYREVHDLPGLLLTEYWRLFRQRMQLRLLANDPARTDIPGMVPIGYGSVPHLLFVITGRNPRLRRLFDLTFALCGLVIAAPLLIVLPILIKLDSPGPILYRHQRVGKHGRLYTMYKFRSMHVLLPLQTPTDPCTAGVDPRLTRIGRWVRRYCLDETPQLFNVLRGEMSVFGPRPEMPQP